MILGRKRPAGPSSDEPCSEVLDYCAYCPKLCSHTCPVSSASYRETLTPWGKQTTLWEMLREMVPVSDEYVEPLFACTECHACREVCDHSVDVPASLRRGRALVFEHGLLPEPLRKMVREHPARVAEAGRSVMQLEGARRPSSSTRVVLFPGCAGAMDNPGLVQDAIRVLDEIAGGSSAVFMDACCGLPLLQAGDRAGFMESGRRLAHLTRDIRKLVVMDPGCAHTISKLYPEHGIEMDVEVTTLPEAVLPDLHRFVRKSNPTGPVFYHDPCQLGRGLGLYDPPREILLRLVAGGARDLHTTREMEPCCGGGGALPVSMDRVAAGCARRLAKSFVQQGARTVVTACPTCHHMLAGQPDLDVVDIVTLMARAL